MAKTDTTINNILLEKPRFHKKETEIQGKFSVVESYLPQYILRFMQRDVQVNYGISNQLAYFLRDYLKKDYKTLEIGAGISTLIFALKNTKHVVITPNESEVVAIRNYANENDVDLSNVTFKIDYSDRYLPISKVSDLDVILIDGKHAFPWPIIDWFYTMGKLKKDGLMIIDDAQIKAPKILKDFMHVDPRWEFFRSFNRGKVVCFRKKDDNVYNVAWHMQPYNFLWNTKLKAILAFILKKLKIRSS